MELSYIAYTILLGSVLDDDNNDEAYCFSYHPRGVEKILPAVKFIC